MEVKLLPGSVVTLLLLFLTISLQLDENKNS